MTVYCVMVHNNESIDFPDDLQEVTLDLDVARAEVDRINVYIHNPFSVHILEKPAMVAVKGTA